MALYKYQISINSIMEECRKFNLKFKESDLEKETRKIAVNQIKNAFDNYHKLIEADTINKIKRKIKL